MNIYIFLGLCSLEYNHLVLSAFTTHFNSVKYLEHEFRCIEQETVISDKEYTVKLALLFNDKTWKWQAFY